MRAKSVCLIHPPHPNSTEDCLDPPLGLAYIAEHVRAYYAHMIDVTIVDLSGMEESQWDIPFSEVYGLTVYAPSVNIAKSIIKKCRSVNPDCITAVGGAHPSAVPMTFHGIADHVVVGMGEMAMIDIVEGSSDFIVSHDVNQGLFTIPAFDLLDLDRYKRRIGGERSLPVLTSRGCPYHCAFCGLALSHEQSPVRMQDPEQLVDQIEHYIDHFGVKAFGFQDDIFTMSKRRLRKMLDGLKPLGINFRCHGRAGLDSEEVYEWLADAGCTQVAWGIESGSQQILDAMNKEVRVSDNMDVIGWAKKHGIDSRAFFVIGFPGETRATIEETKNFIEQADPDQYFCSSFVPYPGTDVWNNPGKYGVTSIDKNFDNFYQVNKDGYGGITVDTEWLSRDDFRDLEHDFRTWIKSRQMRGHLLDYEKK